MLIALVNVDSTCKVFTVLVSVHSACKVLLEIKKQYS